MEEDDKANKLVVWVKWAQEINERIVIQGWIGGIRVIQDSRWIFSIYFILF